MPPSLLCHFLSVPKGGIVSKFDCICQILQNNQKLLKYCILTIFLESMIGQNKVSITEYGGVNTSTIMKVSIFKLIGNFKSKM